MGEDRRECVELMDQGEQLVEFGKLNGALWVHTAIEEVCAQRFRVGRIERGKYGLQVFVLEGMRRENEGTH